MIMSVDDMCKDGHTFFNVLRRFKWRGGINRQGNPASDCVVSAFASLQPYRNIQTTHLCQKPQICGILYQVQHEGQIRKPISPKGHRTDRITVYQ